MVETTEILEKPKTEGSPKIGKGFGPSKISLLIEKARTSGVYLEKYTDEEWSQFPQDFKKEVCNNRKIAQTQCSSQNRNNYNRNQYQNKKIFDTSYVDHYDSYDNARRQKMNETTHRRDNNRRNRTSEVVLVSDDEEVLGDDSFTANYPPDVWHNLPYVIREEIMRQRKKKLRRKRALAAAAISCADAVLAPTAPVAGVATQPDQSS